MCNFKIFAIDCKKKSIHESVAVADDFSLKKKRKMTFWLIVVCVFLGSLLPNVLQWVIKLFECVLYRSYWISTKFVFSLIQALPIAFKATDQEKTLRNQLKELKRELAGISAVDEFARYARIQRKMIKLEEEAQNLGQSRMDSRESIRWKWSKIIQVINVTHTISFIVNHNLTTLFAFPGSCFTLFGNHFSLRTCIVRPAVQLVLAHQQSSFLSHRNRGSTFNSSLAFDLQQC